MRKSSAIILWTLGVLILLVGAFSAWFFIRTPGSATSSVEVPEFFDVESPSKFSREVPEGFAEHKSPRYRASFLYPITLAAEKVEGVGGAQIVTIIDRDADPQLGRGLQVYLSAYSVAAIDEAFVKQYLPGATGFEPVVVDGAQGVAFISNNSTYGELREVWFTNDNGLYEVTAPRSHEQLVLDILETWDFF